MSLIYSQERLFSVQCELIYGSESIAQVAIQGPNSVDLMEKLTNLPVPVQFNQVQFVSC